MIRKIGRFEELNADGRPIKVENDARIPELGSPIPARAANRALFRQSNAPTNL